MHYQLARYETKMKLELFFKFSKEILKKKDTDQELKMSIF